MGGGKRLSDRVGLLLLSLALGTAIGLQRLGLAEGLDLLAFDHLAPRMAPQADKPRGRSWQRQHLVRTAQYTWADCMTRICTHWTHAMEA